MRIYSTLLFLVVVAHSSHAAVSPDVQAFVKQHCLSCHGESDEVEGEVDLNEFLARKEHSAESLGTLIEVIEHGEMPPDGEPRPVASKRDRVVEELKSIRHELLLKRTTLAATPIRRMNRFQYNNAVQDLFDLKCIVFTLPERTMRIHKGYFKPESGKMPDLVHVGNRPLGKSQMIEPRLAGVTAFPQDLRAENGFDNRGDHLSLSPLLLESFLRLGRSITESPDFTPQTCGIWRTFFAAPSVTDDRDLQSVVRERITTFLSRAFRRPATPSEIDRYSRFTLAAITSGEEFTSAMRATAAAVIASPKFLYLADAKTVHSNDFALASRLSFFLWGSIPDETLFDLAAKHELSQPDVLAEQVDRMLLDPRVKRFCDSFPGQWLQLDRLISSTPNRERFPDFYFAKYRSSMHMMLEPLLLFETVLIEDQSILQFIDSDFSYRSELLDGIYYRGKRVAKKPPTMLPFRRVEITDRRQGGLITNAAVMTMTSGTERTKPITRGSWLATVIFNRPPEPPPADVPPLPEEPAEGEENQTLRERLAKHREHTSCAGCHQGIDPLGFALENYGPTGKWRDQDENGNDIDMAGRLFDRRDFANVEEFKDAVLAEKDRFARGFASHLLSFSLARALDAGDDLALDAIVSQTKETDYRLKSIVKAVVLSDPFSGAGR
ncbi:MAG: DUF1592 domain-containing protein [Planctomycetota bacterium]